MAHDDPRNEQLNIRLPFILKQRFDEKFPQGTRNTVLVDIIRSLVEDDSESSDESASAEIIEVDFGGVKRTTTTRDESGFLLGTDFNDFDFVHLFEDMGRVSIFTADLEAFLSRPNHAEAIINRVTRANAYTTIIAKNGAVPSPDSEQFRATVDAFVDSIRRVGSTPASSSFHVVTVNPPAANLLPDFMAFFQESKTDMMSMSIAMSTNGAKYLSGWTNSSKFSPWHRIRFDLGTIAIDAQYPRQTVYVMEHAAGIPV